MATVYWIGGISPYGGRYYSDLDLILGGTTFQITNPKKGIAMYVPHRGRNWKQAQRQFAVREDSKIAVVIENWNARASWKIVGYEGCSLVWEYSDGHGMEGCAVFKITDDDWYVDIDIPKHHRKGWIQNRYSKKGKDDRPIIYTEAETL